MKLLTFIAAAFLLTGAVPSTAPESKTYTGVITDTMCKLNHTSMNIPDNARCVRECVGDGKTYKYALAVGTNVYTLSDQETPAKYAAQRVTVKGVLYPKTNILKVETIKPIK